MLQAVRQHEGSICGYATAFFTSPAFAIFAINVIALVLHYTVN